MIPLSLLCGCLSKAAVDKVVESAATAGVIYEKLTPEECLSKMSSDEAGRTEACFTAVYMT